MTKHHTSTRATIITTLQKIHEGQSLTTLLDACLTAVNDNERAFAHELLLGTLRQWHAINRIGESLIKNPPSDIGIVCALNMGLYELLYMNTPDYALINETLNALKSLNKNYGVSLINAILRKVAKDKDKFLKKVNKNHSLPNWLAKQLKQDFGDYYETLGQTLRQSAPIFLRPNVKLISLSEYSQLLKENHIKHTIVDLGFDDKQCIKLLDNIKIPNLPKFKDGFVSVQDKHAQLSGHILDKLVIKNLPIDKAIHILDACSAPAGKTAHLLELFAKNNTNAIITAMDNDNERLAVIPDNLTRLGLLDDKVKIVCDDACIFKVDTPFDVILLDAPCSATGVIRRHPDINLLRSENDIKQTVKLQADILNNAWKNLKDGGYLLYVTCSLLKDENERQIKQFLNTHSNAKAVEFVLSLPNQIKQEVGYQCLPLNQNDGDGFYYALLQKVN
ncbi:16S rRNA (cytosine(967)-C(5))-methyltransferase RsmB [Moraxella oblonga]|uniref:16S rRNA (cytosine(967)-C(5))-methyltransferase RsmB n=1 Tax=Moraxella oblonga TaxID=200413 RepID=UPI00083224D2|nr:16S rRNA (cytosine(967)-C(5))-methyltransferase RsmB [Moraxella oblonga]